QRLEKVADRGEHERRRGRRHREAVTWQEARLVLRAPAHTVRDTSAPAGGHHATARPYEPHYLGELGGVQLPWRVEHQEDGRCRPPPPPPPPPRRPPAPALPHENRPHRRPPRPAAGQPPQHVAPRAARPARRARRRGPAAGRR